MECLQNKIEPLENSKCGIRKPKPQNLIKKDQKIKLRKSLRKQYKKIRHGKEKKKDKKVKVSIQKSQYLNNLISKTKTKVK